MDEQNRNLILAMVLSLGVLLGWSVLFPPPDAPPPAAQNAAAPGEPALPGAPAVPLAETAGAAGPAPVAPPPAAAATAAEASRIPIETPRLEGSISLAGARIDDLRLADYRESLRADSETVTLLSPETSPHPYFALFGWTGLDGLGSVPGRDTIWTSAPDAALAPGRDVTLTWENGAGLAFTRTIAVDADYVFTVTDRVDNTGAAPARLAPYGQVFRYGLPEDYVGRFIVHEGAIRQSGKELDEITYEDLRDLEPDAAWGPQADVARIDGNGWIGLTDHYWMTVLVPDAGQAFTGALLHSETRDVFSAVSRLPAIEVAPGGSAQVTQRLFAGAKEWEAIRAYEDRLGIYRFVDSIDWGWFFFLTKPIFALLHWLNAVIGNMGWAIIALTFIIKSILFPLAYKSYVSMARMKELQPEMEKIKERAGEDRQKLQAEMMALYRDKKVNPAAGCLPILLQIPIFFSLYKVIFVTIELRHAPWLGWIRDLSAPDPSSLFNLWGLLPWAAPEPGSFLALIFIGVLPLVLGISMWLQQKLNPAPADPTQAMIFAWMPWVFMFMLGNFASGLVLYWIANNTLTFIQQYAIMRSHGTKPDVFGNIRRGLARRWAGRSGAAPKK